MIEFTDLIDITKLSSHNTTPFTVGVFKLKCLKALKFWIEDKLRMNKPLASAGLTCNVLNV